MDKVFLKEAIEKVYIESVIKKDKEMEKRTIDMLNNDLFTKEEKISIQNDLNEISEKYSLKLYNCYIDGAVNSQSVNVSAAISSVVYHENDVFYKTQYRIPEKYTSGHFVQNTSSHMAEYEALVVLLRMLKNKILMPERARITVHTDSEILKGQYYSEYRISNPIQKELREQVFDLAKHFEDVIVKWVPREENTLANDLAQELI